MDSDTRIVKDTTDGSPLRTQILDPEQLRAFVVEYQRKGAFYLNARDRMGSPLYIFEEDVLRNRAGEFASAFRDCLDNVNFFYAVKSNNYPGISRTMVSVGFGLDVSSGRAGRPGDGVDGQFRRTQATGRDRAAISERDKSRCAADDG